MVSSDNTCPEHFEGRVQQIINQHHGVDVFKKNKVVFETLRAIRGDVLERVEIEILDNGPFSVELNQDYQVYLRKGKLCWLEKI